MTLPFVFVAPYGNYSRDESMSVPPNGAPPGSSQGTIEPR